MYEKCFKRILDFSLSFIALTILSPIFLVLIAIGSIAMRGNPFFVQKRPGKIDKNGKEKIFNLIKFRTMDNRKDALGNFLPDEVRLNKYGQFLRASSLDELPELINILIGQMSIVGPRPQLVRDMVFMTPQQRQRHTVRPGLSGLAQINGRNAIDWNKKLALDLEYIENISFLGDVKIVFITVLNVLHLVHNDEISEETEIVEDYGDYLLGRGEVNEEDYAKAQDEALKLLEMV